MSQSMMRSRDWESTSSRHVGVIIIGIFKLVKAFLLFAVAIGALSILDKDFGTQVERWITTFRGDPDNRYINSLLQKATGLNERKLQAISVGTFIYAAIFLTEGIGLILRKRWAEFLTVIVTASFVPLEIYEIIKHPTVMKIGVLVINLAILWYLIIRLRHRDETG
jgi:uncharacterized membrane protein (DUF2068 family)